MAVRNLLKVVFYPSVIVFAILLHLLLNAINLPANLVPSLTVFFVLIVVVVSEYLMPFFRPWLKSESRFELLRDAASTLVMLPIVMEFCRYFWDTIFPHFEIWPNNYPFIVRLVIAVLLAEFFFYWTHRLSHEVGFLWRFHSVHHSVKRVYWLNSGTLHPIDAFLDFFVYFFPIVVIGVDRDVFLMFLTLTMTTGVLEHANVDYRAGKLNFIFNTGELHRWHHSKVIAISKKNCGKILSVWDLVFGTFYLPKHTDGIQDVGVE